ncbi:MAG: hypothetical protein ABI678_06025 [Kofleriaceae bacterium]
MGRLLWLAAALSAAGCGKVALAPDGTPADVLPDTLSCSGTEIACSGSCVESTNDPANCGFCGNQCSSGSEMCMAGHCVSGVDTCNEIKSINSMAPTGFYTLANGSQIYCEMTHADVTYEDIGMGQFDLTYPGFDRITLAEFTNPLMQTTFIALMNRYGGAQTMTDYVGDPVMGNCCFKVDDTANVLTFGAGNYLTPATAPSTIVCGTYVPGTRYTVALMESSTMIQAIPLPATFFSAHPAATAAVCATSKNPAFFWKRH